jgi:hypothetical protein
MGLLNIWYISWLVFLCSPFSIKGPQIRCSTFLSNMFNFPSSPLGTDQVSQLYIKIGRKKLEYKYFFDFLDNSFPIINLISLCILLRLFILVLRYLKSVGRHIHPLVYHPELSLLLILLGIWSLHD